MKAQNSTFLCSMPLETPGEKGAPSSHGHRRKAENLQKEFSFFFWGRFWVFSFLFIPVLIKTKPSNSLAAAGKVSPWRIPPQQKPGGFPHSSFLQNSQSKTSSGKKKKGKEKHKPSLVFHGKKAPKSRIWDFPAIFFLGFPGSSGASLPVQPQRFFHFLPRLGNSGWKIRKCLEDSWLGG